MCEKIIAEVKVIKPFLNLVEGDILSFNYSNGKYEFVRQNEDVSEFAYGFDNYELSIEPYVVEDNMGEYFVAVEQLTVVGEQPCRCDGPEVDIENLLDRVIALEEQVGKLNKNV